jgi:hypothetical protein
MQRPHRRDPREHGRPVLFDDQQQGFHRRLPFGGVVFCLRQPGDVLPGVPQRNERTSVRQRYRVIEATDHPPLFAIWRRGGSSAVSLGDSCYRSRKRETRVEISTADRHALV